MAPEVSVGDGAMDARLHQVSVKLDDLEAAQRSARIVSWMVTLAVFAAVAIGIYQLWQVIEMRMDERPEYGKAIEREVESLMPAINSEVDKLIADIRPDLERVLIPKFQNEWLPQLERVVPEQIVLFADEMQTTVVDEGTRIADRLRNRAEASLLKDVPELKDPDKTTAMMNNAATALNAAVDRLMEKYLRSHIDSVLAIETKVVNMPVPDRVRSMSDTELSEHLNNLLKAFAANQFRDSLTPEARQFLAE